MSRFAIAFVLAAGIHLGNVTAEEDAQQVTPMLDIKPYALGQDSATEVRVPDWAKPK